MAKKNYQGSSPVKYLCMDRAATRPAPMARITVEKGARRKIFVPELENHLSDLLGVEVDLVRKEAIREELKETILRDTVM